MMTTTTTTPPLTPDCRRSYSWWWDSHISPKNSKWLQENLTDMDSKIKAMIKLIEEDADSFARRAEMYYKKRPELMKLVEEFYRAYRALAERYDHATGELRHAHKTIAQVLNQDQISIVLSDDYSPCKPSPDPHTPLTPPTYRSSFDFQSGMKALNDFMEGMQIEEVIKPTETETEVENLKNAIALMVSDKESFLVKYQTAMKELTVLEEELSLAKKNSTCLSESAKRAETETLELKEQLLKVEAERDSGILQQQDYLEKIINLESSLLNHAEEKEFLKKNHEQCLHKITDLEEKLSVSREESASLKDLANRAQNQVINLEKSLSEWKQEKDNASLQYTNCLDKISNLEEALSKALEDIKRLSNVILSDKRKLDSAVERNVHLEALNQSLQLEADHLTKKISTKDRELFEKQEGLEKLQDCLRDERFHLVQVETALETLTNLHSRSQEEQKALTMDLKKGLKMLNDEQVEILRLREMKEKLENQLTVQMDQTGALQNEITNLKDEILLMNQKHSEVMEQLKSAGVAVKLLQDENSRLQRIQVEDMVQKCDLLKKVEDTEKVLEEKSSLAAEKASLLSQLQIITENMQKLFKENILLENSLSVANVELSQLRAKSKGLEELNELLRNEKSNLLTERGELVEQLESVERKLENLDTRFTDLEKVSSTGTRLASLESNIENLRDESRRAKKNFEEELGRAVNAQLEILVLQKFVQDMEKKNYSLILECQKHTEASKLAEKLINELESENLEQQVEGEILLDEIGKLRLGIYKVFQALDLDHELEEKEEEEDGKVGNMQFSFLHVLGRIKDLKNSLANHEDQSHHLSVENSVLMTLLKQVKLDGREKVEQEKETLNREIMAMKSELEKKETEILFLKEELVTKSAGKSRIEEEEEEDNDNWSSELKEMSNEFEMWEAEAATFYFDLQLSNVREVLYESKVHELSETCQALESESASKAVEIRRMKERVGLMENEIGGLKAQLSAFVEKDDANFEEDFEEEEDMSELQRLQFRVEAVEKAVILQKDEERTKPEILEEESSTRNGNLTKDIPLDQVSNSSNSLRRRVNAKGNARTDDRMLELWETAAEDRTIVHIPQKNNTVNPKPQFDSSKIAEVLAKDSEKLTKLKTTMMELRSKLEEEKLKKKKDKKKCSFDIETVKEQLEEVDEAIVQFTSLNGQMMRNLEENEGEKGLRVYQLVRKGSESVARLELEVQKIQYVLVKNEEEEKKISKAGGIKFSKNKTNIILKSLLIHNSSSPRQKKKRGLCGCFNPSTPTTAARISL